MFFEFGRSKKKFDSFKHPLLLIISNFWVTAVKLSELKFIEPEIKLLIGSSGNF